MFNFFKNLFVVWTNKNHSEPAPSPHNFDEPQAPELPTPTDKKLTFSQWFEKQGFIYFDASEFEWLFDKVKDGVKNSEPPREIWSNCLQVFVLADNLRYRLNSKYRVKRGEITLSINSSYRNPAYNKAVGGANSSQHLQFTALDIHSNKCTPKEVYDTALKMREEGYFKGGIGIYHTFVHIDTRGSNANWKSY